MDDLQGLHIVITRPFAQAEPWAKRLVQLGATVSLVPLLDIVAVQDDAQVQAIKNRILNFDLYSKAIFVSQNAVEYGLEWLDNYWPQLPIAVNYFAVGETTTKLLQLHGITVTDLAQTQSGAMTSETLLQSPALQQVQGEKIIIFRGVGGRPHLGEELQARGAQVDYCELYERRLPATAFAQFAQILTDRVAKNITRNAQNEMPVPSLVVALHSGESLKNLTAIINQMSTFKKNVTSELTLMQQLILLVPSERVAEQAIDAGFNTIFAAENATDASMLQRLLDIAASLENQFNLTKGHTL